MDGYPISFSYYNAGFAFLLGVINIFSLVKSQFFSFAKHVQRVFSVFFCANVFQVIQTIILFVSVFMVDLRAGRTRADKRPRNHAVDRLMPMYAANSERNKQIPVNTQRGGKYFCVLFVRRAAQYFANDRLANVKTRGNFSCAKSFGAKLKYCLYLFFGKGSLRQVCGAKTFNAPVGAYFVHSLKLKHRKPSFHENSNKLKTGVYHQD